MEDGERQHLLNEIAKRDQIIALLEQKVDMLTRRIFGVKSEALDPAQLEMLFGGDEAKKAEAAGGQDDAPAAEEKTPKRRKQRKGGPRLPEHLPVEETVIVPLVVQAAPDEYREIGEEVTERLDYKPARFVRQRSVRKKFVRKEAPLSAPVIAPLPPCLQERCLATPGLIAEVLHRKYTLHQPLYRMAEEFLRLGVDLARQTLCDWTKLAANWLEAIYRHIAEEHHQSGFVQIDETPIHYLEPGCGKARQGYLWTSSIPGGSVLYHWQKGRDQSGIDHLLGMNKTEVAKHKRTIQCDGFSAYPSWAKGKPHITLMGCHAHVRRKFYEAKDQAPRIVAWVLKQLANLYRIEERLRENRAGPALREAVRQSESRPIHQRLKRAIELLAKRRYILRFGAALNYALNQWGHLEVYLSDGRVPIDNNLVENAIRPSKLGARNWMFIGREEAGGKAAVIYTIIENCRRLDINPREYLEDVLTRLPAMTNQETWQMTPVNWQRSRQGKPLRQAA